MFQEWKSSRTGDKKCPYDILEQPDPATLNFWLPRCTETCTIKLFIILYTYICMYTCIVTFSNCILHPGLALLKRYCFL